MNDVLEEFGADTSRGLKERTSTPLRDRPWHLFTFAARSRAALDALTPRVAAWLVEQPQSPAVLAAALRRALSNGPCRRAVVARDAAGAASALIERHPDFTVTDEARPEPPPVAFLFPGGGAQRVNMGRDLYETEPEFRRVFDESAESLRRSGGVDVRELVFAEPERADEAESQLMQTDRFMPVMFAFCHALARQWMAWGVQPSALLGHSLGEYVAATLAGVFEPADALRLVAERGVLIQRQPAGAMLIVWLPEADIQSVLFGRLTVAAVNGPGLCVVSGPAGEIEVLEHQLAAKGATTRRLQIDHAAHSWMMEGAMEPLAAQVRRLRRAPPRLPYVSNLTGSWISPEEATDPAYYARHLRQPVRFAEGLSTLLQMIGIALVEVGPGQALAVLARQHPRRSADQRVVSSLFGVKDENAASMMLAAGRLWSAGVVLAWDVFDGPVKEAAPVPAEVLSLARGEGIPTGNTTVLEDHPPRTETEARLALLWGDLLKQPAIPDRRASFFDLGGYSLLALQLAKRIRETWLVEVSLQSIFAAPSIEGVARAIDSAVADRDRHPLRSRCLSLTPIQAGGDRAPLFVIPGGNGEDGELYVHAGLSEYHYGPHQPLYGLRRRGWDGRGAIHASVEEMARDYIAEIRTVQPEGPYYLHGDCAGGPVAYEMARQIVAGGEAVGLLMLTDSQCPRPFELQRYALARWGKRLRRTAIVALFANVWEVLQLRGGQRRRFVADKIAAARRRLGGKTSTGPSGKTGAPPGAGVQADPIRAGFAARHAGEEEFWTAGGLRYWQVTQRYRPGRYAGPVHLIVSGERSRLPRIAEWRKYASDVRMEVVPGSHWLYLWHHGDRVAARVRESQNAESPR